MTRQGCSHGWALFSSGWALAHPGWGARHSQSEWGGFPTKGLYYRQNYSSVSSGGWFQSWRGYTLWCQLDILPKPLKWRWRQFMVEKWTLNSLATALVDIPAVSMTIAHSVNTWDLWHCVVWQNCTKKWPFIVPSTRCTCVMIMMFNHLLDMPHLSGGWIILAKEKCSLRGM